MPKRRPSLIHHRSVLIHNRSGLRDLKAVTVRSGRNWGSHIEVQN